MYDVRFHTEYLKVRMHCKRFAWRLEGYQLHVKKATLNFDDGKVIQAAALSALSKPLEGHIICKDSLDGRICACAYLRWERIELN